MTSYTSLEALLHDAFWAEEDTPELHWIDSLLRANPEPALEIGSGSGRLLLPLLKKGHTVEGLEPSADMLDLCRRRAAELGLAPVLHEGDMTTFAPGKTYAGVIVPAFTLQLADDPAAALANLQRLLKPGGLLYLTVFLPFAEIDGELPENEWYPDHRITLPDGLPASVETRFQLDRPAQILHRQHHYRLEKPMGTLEHRSEQTIRWFDHLQLHQLLTDAGFIPENALSDFDEQTPVDDDSQIITVIAHKL